MQTFRSAGSQMTTARNSAQKHEISDSVLAVYKIMIQVLGNLVVFTVLYYLISCLLMT